MDATQLAAQFERDGYALGLGILQGADVERVRREFDALEAREGRDKAQIGFVDRHFDEQFVWDLATQPRILDAVEAVMGPDILLLATHFFCKYGEPGADTGKFVAWHQDVTYWGLEPPFALTAWYAVDDSDAANGCMRAIPGTHDRIREHGTANRAGNLLSINQEAMVTPEEEARAIDLPLHAGEISLHHGSLIHGSNPNTSGRRRCGLTIRYIPPTVRQSDENSMKRPWRPILVRGEDRYHRFALAEAPFPQAVR